jgi:hypothetical protein
VRRWTLLPWFGVLAAAGAVAAFDTRSDGGDGPYFLDAARVLLSGRWAETYADPGLQSGPLQLLFLGTVDATARAVSLPALALLAFFVEVVAAAAILLVLHSLVGGRAGGRAAVVAGGFAAVALGLPHSAFVDGHPAQLFVPLLWLVAARAARDGRTPLAGVLVGVSAGFETWGILGVAVLALAPSARRAAAGLAASVAAAAALYAPFALAGSFRMFELAWSVDEGTLISLVLEPGSPFPWSLRLLQGAAALAAGVAVAVALRRTTHAVWAGLAALVAVRIALDPVVYSWYWLAFQVLVVVGAVELLTSTTFARLRGSRSGSRASVPMRTA